MKIALLVAAIAAVLADFGEVDAKKAKTLAMNGDIVPEWKDVVKTKLVKKITLKRVKTYWNLLELRDVGVFPNLFKSKAEKNAAKKKVNDFYDDARDCLNKHKISSYYTKTKFNAAMVEVKECIYHKVPVPNFEVEDDATLPPSYFEPLAVDEEEDTSDPTENEDPSDNDEVDTPQITPALSTSDTTVVDDGLTSGDLTSGGYTSTASEPLAGGETYPSTGGDLTSGGYTSTASEPLASGETAHEPVFGGDNSVTITEPPSDEVAATKEIPAYNGEPEPMQHVEIDAPKPAITEPFNIVGGITETIQPEPITPVEIDAPKPATTEPSNIVGAITETIQPEPITPVEIDNSHNNFGEPGAPETEAPPNVIEHTEVPEYGKPDVVLDNSGYTVGLPLPDEYEPAPGGNGIGYDGTNTGIGGETPVDEPIPTGLGDHEEPLPDHTRGHPFPVEYVPDETHVSETELPSVDFTEEPPFVPSTGGGGTGYIVTEPPLEPPLDVVEPPLDVVEPPLDAVPASVYPFSPVSRIVPPLWALDVDANKLVSRSEWYQYVHRLYTLATDRASKGEDVQAVDLLHSIIDFHYFLFNECVNKKIVNFPEDLNEEEYEKVSKIVEEECPVKFRYWISSSPPPFEWIAKDNESVSVKDIEAFIAKYVAKGKQSIAAGHIAVSPEEINILHRIVDCAHGSLSVYEDTPINRSEFYQFVRSIEKCAN